jgi:hypothetical protein
MSFQGTQDLLARFSIPETQSLVLRTRNKPSAISRKSQASDFRIVAGGIAQEITPGTV